MMDLLDEGTNLEEARHKFLESNESVVIEAVSELLRAFHNHHSSKQLVDRLRNHNYEELNELASQFDKNTSNMQSMIDQMSQKLASIYPLHAFVCDLDDRISIDDAQSCREEIQNSNVSYGTITLPIFATEKDLKNNQALF